MSIHIFAADSTNIINEISDLQKMNIAIGITNKLQVKWLVAAIIYGSLTLIRIVIIL